MAKSTSLRSLLDWYQQRPLRERIMLLACLLVVMFFLWDTLVMSPISLRKKRVESQTRQLWVELTELNAREQVVQTRKDYDPDRENRRQLEQLQAETEDIQQQLEKSISHLISPQEMPELLKELLIRQQKLQLISLENLPAEGLEIGAQTVADQLTPVLYRHRLQLEFTGDYLATLEYLKKIEKLPRRLVWEEVEIETQDYPQAKVRLQVYTLSLNKGWIGG